MTARLIPQKTTMLMDLSCQLNKIDIRALRYYTMVRF